MVRFGLRAMVVASLLQSPVWAADVVEYTDDSGKPNIARGNIREESDKEVVIQTTTGQERIPVYQIDEVKYDKAPAQLVNVRSMFDQGRYDEVITQLKEIGKQLPQDQTMLQQAVAFQVFAAEAEQALVDPSQAKDALEWYSKLGDAFTRTRHYFPIQEYLGRVYLSTSEYGKADEAFQKLEMVDWPGFREKATVYRAMANIKQDQHDMALTLLEPVINSPGETPEQVRQKQRAQIFKAKALVGTNKAKEAEELLAEVLENVDAEEHQVLAVGYNTLGDALKAQKKPAKEVALKGYLVVVAVPSLSRNPDETAYALYNLVPLFQEMNQPERAQTMAQTLKTDYPNSEWAKKLSGS